MVADQEAAPIIIEKAQIEVRRFMTADLHAKYQFIFNEIYAERAANTLFPNDHGTFHPFYTSTYMHLCGLIGSLMFSFPIRTGIPWMYFRKGNGAIIPNVRGITEDKISKVFFSTETSKLYQVASPAVRWVSMPRGIGRRYILAKSMFVTQDPVRPFLLITNTSHQVEWVRILLTVNGWSIENGDVFVVGSGQHILVPKVIIVNCHDYWMIGPMICNATMPVGLTIVDSSALTDDPWFQPPLSNSMIGQVYPSPILVYHYQIKRPCLKMFDCGPIARMIYMALTHQQTDAPMAEFMLNVYSIDQYNAYPNFSTHTEMQLKSWIPVRKERRIVQSSLAFRTSSQHLSANYTHRMIGVPRWVSAVQVSQAAKRLAQAMCHILPFKAAPIPVYSNGGKRAGRMYTLADNKAKNKTCDDMFLYPLFSHKFDDTNQQRCTDRTLDDWECTVCYCRYDDCPNSWDALVTQCCTTEICSQCYFNATRLVKQCVVCGPESRNTMPFVPAVCVYGEGATGEMAAESIPKIPEVEFKPFQPVRRTFMGIDYPRILFQCLRQYIETFPEVFILMTPPPFHQRVNLYNLAPYIVEFTEKSFREHNGLPRIIMWDPESTPITQLPIKLPFITDIVIGDYHAHKGNIEELKTICDRETISLRYVIWNIQENH